MKLITLVTLIFTMASSWMPSLSGAEAVPPFELRDGDRVILLGDTLIEREQYHGYFESRLHLQFPDRKFSVRNLGWSGDTPFGESRAGLSVRQAGIEPPDEGWRQLQEQIRLTEPTVVFLGYGMASSFNGPAGVSRFKSDLQQLVKTIEQIRAGSTVRFVFLGPIRHEKLPPPLPDPASHNQSLSLYSEAVRQVAAEKQAPFVSLFNRLAPVGEAGSSAVNLTDNGIHLSAYGSARMAEVVAETLGWGPNRWRSTIFAEGGARNNEGIVIINPERKGNGVQFAGDLQRGVSPLPRETQNLNPFHLARPGLQIMGLPAGRYTLRIDGEVIQSASAEEWRNGQFLSQGPFFDQTEKMRQAIVKKNELFFHRSRPQNMAYILGFRKGEQGRNAVEIPRFDPLAQELDAQIDQLKKPVRHQFELTQSAAISPARKSDASKKTEVASLPTQVLPNFEVAEGLEVNLFAQNPLLAKPIQMNFDPRGRLWVVSSSVYPQIEPGQTADDKVVILEDTDADGRADISQVFAEGLLIPSAIEPGDGGVYVGQSTELLHFRDTDNDGKADQRRVVLSGFGTEDTHHILHTLRWGHDGQLYFNQSIYIRSHIETPNGVVRLNSGGTLNLKPASLELGIFTRGLINHWGHHFDEFGQSFLTDGAGGQAPNGIFYAFPGATYVAYAGARRILGSISPGNYPKFCGLEVIYSDHFPADWQGNMVTCDFRAHRVVRFGVSEKDSAYVTREMPDILRTTNNTFRPIDVKVGPDGAIYVADWANPIIQHGEVDFRDPRRDHTHGRIWRITAKGRKANAKIDFTSLSTPTLLTHLVSSNGFDRHQARRVLTERQVAITNDLAAWIREGSDKKKLEGLWLYQSLGLVQPTLLGTLLESRDGRIRAAATRVASDWIPRLQNAMNLLQPRARDEHPRVRLEAIRALAKIPSATSADLVLGVLNQPMDPFLEYGLWLSINELARPWLAAVQSGEWKVEGKEPQFQYALRALPPEFSSGLLAQVANKPLPRDGGAWIEILAQAGGANELRSLFLQVVEKQFDASASARALKSLSEAARLRNARPSGDLTPLAGLFSAEPPEIAAAALRLAGSWKLAALLPQILQTARETKNPVIQKTALESTRDIGGPDAVTGLKQMATSGESLPLKAQAVVALSGIDLSQGGPLLGAIFKDASWKEPDALEIWRSLLSSRNVGPKLAGFLPASGLPEAVTRAGLRAAREGGRQEPELIASLSRHLAAQPLNDDLSEADLKKLARETQELGDPARGEKIYRQATLGCVSCHAIGGVGGKVGPDLTSMGASAPLDYVVESVIAPNRKIKEGFHSIMIQTKDDQEFSGILVRESAQEVVLRDAANLEKSIAKNNLQSRSTGLSLMPSGLLDHLSSADRYDLFRFLGELGRPGPFDASRGNVARHWRLFPRNITTAQFGDEKFASGDFSMPGWTPAFTLVDGRLLKSEMETVLKARPDRHPDGVYAAAQFETARPVSLTLNVSPSDVRTIWVDGKPWTEKSAGIPAGKHTVVFYLTSNQLPEALRVEISEGSFLVQ